MQFLLNQQWTRASSLYNLQSNRWQDNNSEMPTKSRSCQFLRKASWSGKSDQMWEFGDLGAWKSRNAGSKKSKFSKFKSVLPEMSARSGLVGNKSSWPYLGPSEAIFSIGRKNRRNAKFCLFSLVGQWALFTRFELACGVLTVQKGYQLVSCKRAVPP